MNPGKLDRAYWIDTLRRIADPVLVHLSKRELKLKMPIETNGEIGRDMPVWKRWGGCCAV